MSRFTRMEVLNKIIGSGMVPLFYHPDSELCKQVIKACYKGGARVFEFTNRGDFAHEVFADVKKWAALECPEMALGVGSVVDSPTAALYIQSGADFIVSPMLNPDMAKTCNRRKIAWMPGCGTLSEISHAEELGVEIVKIFPGKEVGGPSFVKAIKGPCPWTSIMPSGGVSPDRENLQAWFDAGVVCVGLGSQLFTKQIIKDKQFDVLEKKVKETLAIIDGIKNR